MTTQDTQVMKMKLLQSKSCYTLRSYVYFEKSCLDFSVHGDLLRSVAQSPCPLGVVG